MKDSDGLYLSDPPNQYPMGCFDTFEFSVKAHFSVETLYQLPPFFEKVVRALDREIML